MSYCTDSKRVKIVRVTSEFLASLLMQQYRRQVVVIRGLPPDAKLVGVDDKVFFGTNEVALKFMSELWPEVPEGHDVEEFRLECATINFLSILSEPEKYAVKNGKG